jgi:hypothetical protein
MIECYFAEFQGRASEKNGRPYSVDFAVVFFFGGWRLDRICNFPAETKLTQAKPITSEHAGRINRGARDQAQGQTAILSLVGLLLASGLSGGGQDVEDAVSSSDQERSPPGLQPGRDLDYHEVPPPVNHER